MTVNFLPTDSKLLSPQDRFYGNPQSPRDTHHLTLINQRHVS